MPPKRSAVCAYIEMTCFSSATSTVAASGSPEQSATVSSAASPFTSAAHTLAPSSVKRIAASRPIPPPAPVITATLPSSRPMSGLRGEEHRLDLRVAVERLHPELPTEARLLEAPERRLHAHGAVRVDRDHACLERPGDSQGPGTIARPDRARESVRGVVRDPDRVGLVVERDHRGDRAEDLLSRDAVVVRRLHERAR